MIEQTLERIAKALEALVELKHDNPVSVVSEPGEQLDPAVISDKPKPNPKKKRKRRTKAELAEAKKAEAEAAKAEVEEEEEDDILDDAPPADDKQPTFKDVMAALRALVDATSMDRGRSVLGSLGAGKISDLDPKDYAKAIEAFNEAHG